MAQTVWQGLTQIIIVIILVGFIFLIAYDNKYADDVGMALINVMPTYGGKDNIISTSPIETQYSTETSASRPSKYYREGDCRKIIEDLTGKPFAKIRPKFLTNPETGKPLELDCFNSELNIALEYNGVEHYKYTPYFHRTPDAFEKQLQRDKLKEKLCRENGVYLIVVPYSVKNLKQFIVDELNKVR